MIVCNDHLSGLCGFDHSLPVYRFDRIKIDYSESLPGFFFDFFYRFKRISDRYARTQNRSVVSFIYRFGSAERKLRAFFINIVTRFDTASDIYRPVVLHRQFQYLLSLNFVTCFDDLYPRHGSYYSDVFKTPMSGA